MEKVERGIMKNGVCCIVLDELGQRTDEYVRVPGGTNWWYEPLPWSPTPRFIEPHPHQPAPHAHAEIIFARDPTDRSLCAKWAYPSDDIETYYNSPCRLVRVVRNRAYVLWATDKNSPEPQWHQILVMSARWPRLANGSDELSNVYRRALTEGAPERGLMFQIYFCKKWYFCTVDLRAPIEEVPADLRR